MKLNEYVTLGRSGLRISPAGLGTMTFGTDWGFGVDEAASRQLFNYYLEQDGNFIDTADGYTNGTSEELVGKFVAEGKLRNQVVLATKYSFNRQPGNPNAGGDGRKNLYRALEGSLQRLRTDYVDLFWMHVWDRITPVEEVLSTFDALIREGKIRYAGFSDVPAWYLARAQTLAQCYGQQPIIALQLEYSLLDRSIEREHIPAAQELGMGVCPWGALAGGMLSGKYQRHGESATGQGRLTRPGAPPSNRMNERAWRIVDALRQVSEQMGKPAARVAFNWAATQPGITAPLLGATSLAQLSENIAALEFTIPDELRRQLDEASALELVHPYTFFAPPAQARVNGGVATRAWRAAQT